MSTSSDSESSLTPHTSPINPSWWSDSDGRRSMRDAQDADESPWWESECEVEKQLVCNVSPYTYISPNNSASDSSASSVTPAWWSEPSSRQLSTSATEVEVEGGGGTVQAGAGSDNADRKLSVPSNNRKRSREPTCVLDIGLKEPAVSKLKLEPPSPHADPKSVHRDLKRGVFQPLQAFLLFFSVDLLTRICDLTNAHGWERVLEESSLASQDGSWEELTVREMYAFIAVILIMRRRQDVCFGAFWREQPDDSHWPQSLMKRRRFFTILQMLSFSERSEDETRVEVSNQGSAEKSNTVDHTQSSSSKASRKEFRYFFSEVQKIFEVFFHRFEFQFVEEIFTNEGQGNEGHVSNYAKIMPPYCKPSLDEKSNSQSQQSLFGDFEKSTSDLVSCNGKVTALGSTIPDHIDHLGEIGSDSVNRQSVSCLNGGNSKQDKQWGSVPITSNKELPPEFPKDSLPEKTHISSVITVRWQENCFSVTATKGAPNAQARLPSSVKEEKGNNTITMTESDIWQEVFIPCPELVYKGLAIHTEDNSPNSQRTDSVSCVLGKSFFYHYLHLAVWFSTSCNIRRLHLKPNGLLPDTDSLEPILDGMVLLGKPDSVLQSDSDTNASETGANLSSTTTDQSDGDNDSADHAGALRSHKYVQARSRMSHKCALCWSLHQEVRRVHTRCTRCDRHFCLSRFRNCMGEAHQDEEVMKQLWDRETGDVQDTSDVNV